MPTLARRLEGPRKLTKVHNLLFCRHTLCMNYVTNKFLLASFSVWSKQLLCFVAKKAKQKPTMKSFVRFHNQPPLLTI